MSAEQSPPRVCICQPDSQACIEFLAAANASKSLHRPWVSAPLDEEEFAGYIQRSQRSDSAFYWIRRRDNNRLAGVIHLSQMFHGFFCSAYAGFYSFTGQDGRGFMTEGLKLVLREAFGPLGLHRVEANIQPGNARSIALVKRVGFIKEGFSPNYLRINEEWRDH